MKKHDLRNKQTFNLLNHASDYRLYPKDKRQSLKDTEKVSSMPKLTSSCSLKKKKKKTNPPTGNDQRS